MVIYVQSAGPYSTVIGADFLSMCLADKCARNLICVFDGTYCRKRSVGNN